MLTIQRQVIEADAADTQILHLGVFPTDKPRAPGIEALTVAQLLLPGVEQLIETLVIAQAGIGEVVTQTLDARETLVLEKWQILLDEVLKLLDLLTQQARQRLARGLEILQRRALALDTRCAVSIQRRQLRGIAFQTRGFLTRFTQAHQQRTRLVIGGVDARLQPLAKHGFAFAALTLRLRDLDLADVFHALSLVSGTSFIVDADVIGRVKKGDFDTSFVEKYFRPEATHAEDLEKAAAVLCTLLTHFREGAPPAAGAGRALSAGGRATRPSRRGSRTMRRRG